jgi:hypothetical protein
MAQFERHGGWAAGTGRAESFEMLELLAAGTALAQPFGDAELLLEALRAAAERGDELPASPAAERRPGLFVRFLTRLVDRRRMRHAGGEGSGGGGRTGEAVLPHRGLSA